MFQRAIRNDPMDLAVIILSVTATLLLYSEHSVLGVVVWALAYLALIVVLWVRLAPEWLGNIRTSVGGLVILSFAATPPLTTGEVAHPTAAWLSLGFVLILLSGLTMIETIAGYVGVRIGNIPGLSVLPPLPALKRVLQVTMVAAPLALFLLSRFQVDGNLWLAIALPVGAVVLVIYLIAAFRRRLSRRTRAALPRALTELAPDFVLYWDAPKSTAFQIAMWLPYLRRLDRPFFIMVRNRRSWEEALAVASDVPLVLAPDMVDVDDFTVPTLRAVFYTNNAARNTHYVRFQQLTHVQLLHGESDKAPSFNKVTGMYDKVYVAGQAGQDRYANHGVYIDPRKFEIVGRPQVEGIVVSSELAVRPHPIVLYAPTWRGFFADSSYSSLEWGEVLIEQLLTRECTVIFRPHPWTAKDKHLRDIRAVIQQRLAAHRAETGTPHIFGDQAEQEYTINDCFNASDAMIADVSSVVGDYLYSLKPFATTAIGRNPDEFVSEFPLAQAGYVLSGDESQWSSVLDDMLGADPARHRRSELREYYLGSFPEDDYASGFIDAARRDIDSTPPIGLARAGTDGESD